MNVLWLLKLVLWAPLLLLRGAVGLLHDTQVHRARADVWWGCAGIVSLVFPWMKFQPHTHAEWWGCILLSFILYLTCAGMRTLIYKGWDSMFRLY